MFDGMMDIYCRKCDKEGDCNCMTNEELVKQKYPDARWAYFGTEDYRIIMSPRARNKVPALGFGNCPMAAWADAAHRQGAGG